MLVVEKIVGNLDDIQSIENYHLERIHLEPEQLVKRIMRLKTDHGTEIGLNLIDKHDLRDGDILYKDDKTIIALFVNNSKVIVIKPKDIHDMGVIAHQLGNRHLPAQFDGSNMLVEYDYLVERLVKQLNIPYEVKDMKLNNPFRHIKIEGGHDEAAMNRHMNSEITDEHDHNHSHGDFEHSHEHDEHDQDHEHSHEMHKHEHTHAEYSHSHEHVVDEHDHEHSHVEHSHEHKHGEVVHTHNHPENDSTHEHDHEHNHMHEHEDVKHSHIHDESDNNHKHSH